MQSLQTTPAAKRCPRCESTKPVTEFNRDKSKPDGLQACCRECRKEIKDAHAERNPLASTAYKAKWKAKQPAIDPAANEHLRMIDVRKRFEEEAESLTLEHRAIFLTPENRKSLERENAKLFRQRHPEKAKAKRQAWEKANPEAKRKHRNAYRDRHKNDPLHIAKKRIRNRTQQAFKRAGFKKTGTTAALLGCSWDHLREHIESQFVKGMNWKNRHRWHVDHVLPLASATTADELARLAHWTNLAPLWAEDNLVKGDTVPTCQPELPMSYA